MTEIRAEDLIVRFEPGEGWRAWRPGAPTTWVRVNYPESADQAEVLSLARRALDAWECELMYRATRDAEYEAMRRTRHRHELKMRVLGIIVAVMAVLIVRAFLGW